MNDFLTVGELARLTGLSTHAIRFYETKGVLRPASRAPNGHRRYNHANVQWLEFVLRLKKTGMPLAEIRDYAEQRAAGDGSLQTRMQMLERHQDRLKARIAELSACAHLLDEKMKTYHRALMKQKRKAGK